MDDYSASTYGDRIAGVYDELYTEAYETDATVEFLWQLARGGRALELGIGTGRIALPLEQMGVAVTGIDASQAMLDRVKSKPGGDEIALELADFSNFDLGERFDVVFVVFNTLFSLTSQEEQLDCFRCVERHLDDDGLFVVEAFVPDPTRFDRHQRVAVDNLTNDEVVLLVSRHDPINQRVDLNTIRMTAEGTRIYPVRSRYAHPSELDLMGRVAGLRLRDRWGGWAKEPFTSDCARHVSIYERA